MIALPGLIGHSARVMALAITFLLGMGNFACHRAVTGSGHPMIANMPPRQLEAIRWASLALEFALLTGALLAADRGVTAWVWAYAVYTAANLGAAWALFSGKLG